MPATVDDILSTLDLRSDDRELIERARAEIPDGIGHRAMLVDIIVDTMREKHPTHLEVLESWLERLPDYSPFEFRPVEEVLAISVLAANLVHPDVPLREALARQTHDSIDVVLASPMMRPLVIACDGDPGRFIEAQMQARSLVDNFGTRHMDRRGEQDWILTLVDYPPTWAELTLVEYLAGVLEAFGKESDITFDATPERVEIQVRWS